MAFSSVPSHQRTIQLKASIEGVGLHSGKRCRVRLMPAPVDSGVRFIRTDLKHAIEIPARGEYVVDTTLNTTLGKDGATVGTVEHLLSALYGMGVDNVLVEIDGPEVPILDGSAAPFVRLIDQVGVRTQKAPRKIAVVRKTAVVTDGDKELRFSPASFFSVHCAIDFHHPLITNQRFALDINAKSFVKEIASARTFGFAREVEALRQRGLALGGSLENAIVVDDFHILNPEGLRFPDEFVRHKILDTLGDFSLMGMPIVGHLHAHKSGHALNRRMVNKLLNEPGHIEIVTLPELAPARHAGHPASVEVGMGLELA